MIFLFLLMCGGLCKMFAGFGKAIFYPLLFLIIGMYYLIYACSYMVLIIVGVIFILSYALKK